MFRIKTHIQGRERLIAACDEDLVGMKFAEGKLRLFVSPDFYDGGRGDEGTLEDYLRTATVANLVGKKTVNVAIRLGFVLPENVLTIGGVPHAQMAILL